MPLVSDLLPNPFDKNSTLVGLEVKGDVILKGRNLFFSLNSIIGIILGGYFLQFLGSDYRQAIFSIVALLVATFVIRILYLGNEIKIFRAQPTTQDGQSYKNLVLKEAQLNLGETIISLISWMAICFIVMMFFSGFGEYILPFSIPVSITPDLILILLVILNIFNCLFSFITYKLKNNVAATDDYAQTFRNFSIFNKKIQSTSFFPLLLVFLIGFAIIGIPLIVLSPFFFFGLFMLYLSVKEVHNLSNLNYSPNSQPLSNPNVPGFIINSEKQNEAAETAGLVQVPAFSDEKIIGSIYGVLRGAASLQDVFRPAGVGASVSGPGEYFYSENTLVITNHRLLLIQVPVSGGNSAVDGIDYTTMNAMYNRSEIQQKGEIYIQNTPITQMITTAKHDLAFTNIKSFKIISWGFSVEMKNSYKFKYQFFDKEYNQYLEDIVQKTPDLSVMSH